MANATRIKAPVVVVPSDKIILELSEKEAEVIKGLCGGIIGSPLYTARKYTSAVYYALNNQGVRSYSKFADGRSTLHYREDLPFATE